MDVCDMKYPDGFFDIAIDKSTIDALLCGSSAFLNVAKMTKVGGNFDGDLTNGRKYREC